MSDHDASHPQERSAPLSLESAIHDAAPKPPSIEPKPAVGGSPLASPGPARRISLRDAGNT
ncbi:MAG: hypothetical protein AAFR96_00180 [Planctomycetota bacterium]